MNWLDRLLKRVFKFFVIANEENDPYMVRYKVFRTTWFKIFLHHILRSDEDPERHDHPWHFVSLILRGGYYEILKGGGRLVRPGQVVRHRATDSHRLLLDRPSWSLVIVWGQKRVWGFHTDSGRI